jgi:hypothetical protein
VAIGRFFEILGMMALKRGGTRKIRAYLAEAKKM